MRRHVQEVFEMRFVGYDDDERNCCARLRMHKNFDTDGSIRVEIGQDCSVFDDLDAFIGFLRGEIRSILHERQVDHVTYGTIKASHYHHHDDNPTLAHAMYRWKERTLDANEVIEIIAEHADGMMHHRH